MLIYFILIVQLSRHFTVAQHFHNTNQWSNRSTIVHLFEWKFTDIARECVVYLAPHGFGGVQVSPVSENAIVPGRPWWERYQPISYDIITRSGSEDDFQHMIDICNSVGVRIYVDVVINHMAAGAAWINGTGGSRANVPMENYPAVPYSKPDFHSTCSINNYMNKYEVRNCQLVGLPDLNQTNPDVRQRIVDYLNRLVDFGVAGFRVDASKHMWPDDLKNIYNGLNNLSEHYFPSGSRPFIYQEVIDFGGEAVKRTEYTPLGAVTEFQYSMEISRAFNGYNQLRWMDSWGPAWGFLPSDQALVFIDNHDNQRTSGMGSPFVLTYKQPREYKMAIAFMLAHSYGHPRIMSSFAFTHIDQGPPANEAEQILSPTFDENGLCTNGWICEHRWPMVGRMVEFRQVAANESIQNWWTNGNNQIAFCRGRRAFVLFNNENATANIMVPDCMESGHYCDVISGSMMQENSCTGRVIYIDAERRRRIEVAGHSVLAIHINAKLKSNTK